jgi:hypothetical protein
MEELFRNRVLPHYSLTEDPIEYPNCKDYNKNLEFKGSLNRKEFDKSYQPVSFSVLETGNVFTIEPGIYFIDSLIESAKNSEVKNKYCDFDLIEKYRVNYLFFFIISILVESELKIVCWLLKMDTKY